MQPPTVQQPGQQSQIIYQQPNPNQPVYAPPNYQQLPPNSYQQPPPGYQQPPPGYQQPPPGYQQQPPGYQQPPPGYQQQPPPGYQQVPPGYHQPPPGQYGQQPVNYPPSQQQGPIIMSNQASVMPLVVVTNANGCKYCNRDYSYNITRKVGTGTIIMFVILLLLFWPLCWLPFVIDDCKDKVYHCNQCGHVLNTKHYNVC